ncbi:4'-phosphopantetheinyl transferase family protein [Geodermatophilus sp. SYSU D00758]
MTALLPVPPGPATAVPRVAVRWVDVRLVHLGGAADLAAAERVLAPAELARARRGTAPVHRRRVLLRAALRGAAARHLGCRPREVPLDRTPAGRPHLPGTGLDVSCSASGAVGLVAVAAGCRVGVDVEALAPWSDDVLDEGWLAPAEQRALRALTPAGRPHAAARAWTVKEAVLKARGTGLAGGPASVVTTDPLGAGWALQQVPVPDGWVASLVTAPEQEPKA